VCWKCKAVGNNLKGKDEECLGSSKFAESMGEGHRVINVPCSHATTCIICTRCGSWATNRLVNLCNPCPRVPSDGGRLALRKISSGKHPTLKDIRVCPNTGGEYLKACAPFPIASRA
jgi:hypothetical protein